MTICKKITAGFTAATALTTVLGVFAYSRIVAIEHQLAGSTHDPLIAAAISSAKSGIVIGVLLSAVLVALTALFVARGINSALTKLAETLGEGSSQVASVSSQVAGSSQSLAQGASEQAAALEET